MPPSTTLTKGPLPPGTYWRRRIILLVGAAALVFVIAQVLGGSSNGKGGEPVAQQAGATFTTTATTAMTPTATTQTTPTTGATGRTTATPPLTLAAPTGPCSPSDITVTPSVSRAVASTAVTINLALQTKTTAACTWQVDRRAIAVKIARHSKVLWTSQQCPGALPDRTVVVRNVVPSIVTMTWNGQVSTVGCRSGAGFVRPGRLNVYASTLGGEPGHVGFALVVAAPTASATSTATSTATATATARSTARSTATTKSTGQPRR